MPRRLTTEVDSLPCTQPVVDQMFARESGEPVDETPCDAIMDRPRRSGGAPSYQRRCG